MTKFATAAAITLLASSALAEGHAATGDAAAGEEQFNRQCVACHVVATPDGDVVAGRNARTGPNLYGIPGNTLATVEDFRYGKSIAELGESGTIWTEEGFVSYVQDPTAWLREQSGDDRARSKMAYRVRNPEDALNIYAFLATFEDE